MLTAREELNIPHFGCIGHSLHLVAGPFLLVKKSKGNQKEDEDVEQNGEKNEEEDVEENGDNENDDVAEFELLNDEDDISEEIVDRVCKIVSKFRKVAMYIKNSPKAKEKIEYFDHMAKSNNHDTINILLDVRTRWNSASEMLTSMLKLKMGLQSFIHYLKTVDGRKELKLQEVTGCVRARLGFG
jgi:hypothetical protein